MNSEALIVEAWLKAGSEIEEERICPDQAMLEALVTRQLAEPDARRLTAHLTCCAGCRANIASLVASCTVPTSAPIALSSLLARGKIPDSWVAWMRRLVYILPPTDEERADPGLPDYVEISPLRIDDRGRLIVEIAAAHPCPAEVKVRLSLSSDGARLDLCEAAPRANRLYAIVDLSAFGPRAGVLRPGVLSAETVPVAMAAPRILPLLAELQEAGIARAEFWDRFAPLAGALGDRLAAMLAHEAALAQEEQTTRLPRLRPSGEVVSVGAEGMPLGRVQYALDALQEYAVIWRESNGSELPGAAAFIAQLGAVFPSPSEAPGDRPVTPAAAPVNSVPQRRASAIPRACQDDP